MEEYYVLNSEGEHEFTIKKEIVDAGEKITMYRSNSSVWQENCRGEKVISLINSGDDITFDRSIKKIDYAELTYLRVILNFENKTDGNQLNQLPYRFVNINQLIEC